MNSDQPRSEKSRADNADSPQPGMRKVSNWGYFATGILFPFGVFVFEVISRFSASYFFDPLPTMAHHIIVAFVPLVNLLLWLQLNKLINLEPRPLLFAASMAAGFAMYYTIMYAPLMAIGVIAVLYFGIGLLPYAPLLSFWCCIKLYSQSRTQFNIENDWKFTFRGSMLAVCILVILDLPNVATQYGYKMAASESKQQQAKGIEFLRSFGDKEQLLAFCYRKGRAVTGPISALMRAYSSDYVPVTKAQRIYYRVTGESYSQRPATDSIKRRGAMFDNFQGQTQVGEQVEDVSLISSKIDGVVMADEATSYTEWVLEFRNDDFLQREARMQIALPPDGVISRATLWVNGEEREAAFASKGKVIEAYQSVVSTRRDPLLVTLSGKDQVMVQAFPVPPNGGTIKFRLGISAPLKLFSLQKAPLLVPHILETNFHIPSEFHHNLWIESKQHMNTQGFNKAHNSDANGVTRLTGELLQSDMAASPMTIEIERQATNLTQISRLNDMETISQNIGLSANILPEQLNIIVDGSATLVDFIPAFLSSLDAIPENRHVGLILAKDKPEVVTPAPLDAAQLDKFKQLIEQHDFAGGEENLTALDWAILNTEGAEKSQILWITAPQSSHYSQASAKLEQTLERIESIPKITVYPVSQFSLKLPLTTRLLEAMDKLHYSGNLEAQLRGYFQALYATSIPTVTRHELDIDTQHDASKVPMQDTSEASAHVARLWAFVESQRLDHNQQKEDALDFAIRYQLVTPISGAVVLENQQQYDENDLNPVESNTVPTIPEPHEWLLFIIALLSILWIFAKKHKAVLAIR